MTVDEFLNPKSMATPGVAGGLVMALTNALSGSFNLAAAPVALGLSFLAAAVCLGAKRIPWWQRGILFVFNGLIVFSVAVGSNAAGREALLHGPAAESATTVTIPSSGGGAGAADSVVAHAVGRGADPRIARQINSLLRSGRQGTFALEGSTDTRLSVSIHPSALTTLHSDTSLRRLTVTRTTAGTFFQPWFTREGAPPSTRK